MASNHIRRDRIPDEAFATGGDFRQLTDMLGVSVAAADRSASYVHRARTVEHAARPCRRPVASGRSRHTVAMSRSGVLRCLLAAALFGAAAPAASQLADSVPAFTLAGLLYIGAALVVAPAVITRPPTRQAIRSEWRPAALAVVFGGAIGPVLLMAGLARTSAATASILLNTELVATVMIAALFFREHLGSRVITSTLLITAAGAVLAWGPGAGTDVGALLVIAACASWGLDNSVTARIEHLAPQHVVALKGVIAGCANLAIGLGAAGWGNGTDLGDIGAALTVGAVGYGISISTWIKGARDLGAARGQVIFATAPFTGAAIAWIVLGESVAAVQLAAAAIAATGVTISLRSGHEHQHGHRHVEHDHEHTHDEHHDHDHGGKHAHPHFHPELVHAHIHVPDLHHRHDH